jgi:hypothetical protein
MENSVRPESPQFKELDMPEEVADNPYFYEDKPPTPKFIPLPPGVEVATQIEDGELFDFNLEVEPILEVLVGRSLVQARYELIEEDEREEYLTHKKKYEQVREFELINLQRMEAARIRREEEKDRRRKQTKQKEMYNVIIQKKLICKTFAKSYLKGLKKNTISHLSERGYLKDNRPLKLDAFIQHDFYPQTGQIYNQHSELNQIVFSTLEHEKKKSLAGEHKKVVDEVKY